MVGVTLFLLHRSTKVALDVILCRAVVPELLRKNGMDLDQAIEYCTQFDVEPEFATLCYIELILLQPPSEAANGPSSNSVDKTIWARQIRKACNNVEEKATFNCLRLLLRKIHPLHYEKILYVSRWLEKLLAEDIEHCSLDPEVDGLAQASEIDGSDENVNSNKQRSIQPKSTREIALKSSKRDVTRIEKAKLELEEYRCFGDILTYLAGLSCPPSAIRELCSTKEYKQYCRTSMLDTASGSMIDDDVYRDVQAVYRTRIPFWMLITDPWGVIVPIITDSTEMALKLSRLWRALGIDKDEFIARRVMIECTRTLAIPSDGVEKRQIESKDVIDVSQDDKTFQSIATTISTISSPLRRVQLWQWLFTFENSRECHQGSVRAILAGLDEGTVKTSHN